MRQAGGRSQVVGWVALCALSACSGALRASPESNPEREICAMTASPSRTGDSAAFTLHAGGLARDACALRLAAALLRPWGTDRDGRWTVEVAVGDTSVVVRRLDAARARDAIDSRRALLATEDLGLIAYAAAQSGLEVEPLAWDRTYVHLAPRPGDALGARVSADAVRVDARPAELSQCDPGPTPVTLDSAVARSSRVVYETGDATARELAERIVAVAGDTTAAAVGLDPAEFEPALRGGSALAFVVSVPRFPAAACEGLTALVARAPWMTRSAVTPLIDTRAHAIAPRP